MTTDWPHAEILFHAFPEWRALARTEHADDGSTFLVVEVPAPASAGGAQGLVIDTSRGEITVGFDAFHTHFDDWTGDEDRIGTDAALEFIKQVVSERVVIVSWWRDDDWCGSTACAPGAELEAPSGQSANSYNRLVVRSWKGTFDIDIHA